MIPEAPYGLLMIHGRQNEHNGRLRKTMVKPKTRAYARYTRIAMSVFGSMIREQRIRNRMTMEELAERVGISRSLLQRIERGDLTCSIGVVFEAAYIVGVPLLHQDLNALYLERHRVKDILSLLPKSVRPTTVEICDDF